MSSVPLVKVRRLKDNEERWVPAPEFSDDGGGVYMWTSGNYSCDCNRELLFLRAAGEPEPENTACGDQERFVALFVLMADGRKVELDYIP